MSGLGIVVLGAGVRLLATNNAIGIIVCHRRVLGQIILLVLVLIRHHGHGVLARKRRGRELGYHARGRVRHWVVSLLGTSVGGTGTTRTRSIAWLRKSARHGAHVEGIGPCSGRTLGLRYFELRREGMLRRIVRRAVLLLLWPKCVRRRIWCRVANGDLRLSCRRRDQI